MPVVATSSFGSNGTAGSVAGSVMSRMLATSSRNSKSCTMARDVRARVGAGPSSPRRARGGGVTRLVLLAVERRLDVLRVRVLVQRLIVVIKELVVLQAPRSQWSATT
jgi:hypothetical protein